MRLGIMAWFVRMIWNMPMLYKYFKLAAEKGQGMAMFELAKLYEERTGCNSK